MLMQRMGGVAPVRQRDAAALFDRQAISPELRRRNRSAPERRGLWAFPWPLYDSFMSSYQFQAAKDKGLRAAEAQHAALIRVPAEGRSDEHRRAIAEASAALEAEYERWGALPSTRERLRVRSFWVSGRVYTHLGAPEGQAWRLVGVGELARDLRRQYARDLRVLNAEERDLPERSRSHPGAWPLDTDHLEVFLGREARIH
jgi:hypothetical protein